MTAAAVVVAPLAFVVAAVVCSTRPGERVRRGRAAVGAASWVGVGVALAAGIVVAVAGPVASPLLGVAELGLSVRLDALSATMLGMIALLAVAIVRFSATYLEGNPRQDVFLARLAGAIAAVEVLVVAGNLALLVLAWIATSLALHRLLVFHPERRRAQLAARKKFLAARVGDVLLVAASALLYARFGTGELGELVAAVAATGGPGWSLDAVGAAALCLAVAAMLKSAQFPTHGWLVEVMETPTPVSALLHAGILNAGPWLVVRFAFVVDGAHVATTALIVVGATTALFASVVLLTQSSVKVALGYSSAAHMGFMLLVCGLGVYPAAMLHLVAHSFYKAHAFLASGSVIDEARSHGVGKPARLGSPARVLASIGAAVATWLVVGLVVAPGALREPTLVVLGVVLVLALAQILAPTIDSDGPVVGVLRATGMSLGVAVAFFALEAGAHELLYGVVPEITGRTPVHLALAGLVLAVFATVVVAQVVAPAQTLGRRRRALALHLRNGLYANALLDRLVGGLRTPPVARRG